MIGQLRGRLIEKEPPRLLMEVAGVGYDVEASMNTFYRLPEIGQDCLLHTHLVVREDDHRLFGFADKTERQLFRTLIKVNNVGPKLAITLLSSISPDDFVRCIAEDDVASLVRLPGVGKKTAERLIVEMRDRLADWQPADLPASVQMAAQTGSDPMMKEATSALVSLGYKLPEALRAVKQVFEAGVSSSELIRRALKQGMK